MAKCASCGNSFQPRQKRSRACSLRCQKRLNRKPSSRPCSIDGCTRPHVALGWCAKHHRANHPNSKSWSTGNPETRRANLRRKTQLRRARLAGVDRESIDRDAIADRDGWICGLCGLPVKSELAWPDPKSASLDHIVPISKGGDHLRANVQISHLDCNMAKGDRGGGEQLLLIG